MPVFEMQTPDGRKFEINADNQEKALSALKSRSADKPPEKTETESKPPPSQGGVGAGLKEFFKSAGTGAVKTAADFARGEQIESEQRAMAFGKPNAGPKVPTGSDLVKAFGLHEPQGFWGEAGQLTGEFAVNPVTYFGPGSAIGKFMTTAGAIFGGAAGKELTKGTSLEPVGEIAGAVGGGFGPAAALKGVTPIITNTARSAAAQVFESEGITGITAGQRTGNRAVEYWEGFLGDAPFAGAKGTAAREESNKQFTRAALRRAGIDSDVASPKVIDQAFTDIGAQMDALAARTDVRMDTKLVKDVLATVDDYNLTVQEGSRRGVIEKTAEDFMDRLAQSPVLTGEQAQKFRSRLLRLQRGAFNDPEYSSALGDIVGALDGAIERSIANPADLEAWRLVRRQYKNLIPLAQAATGAGEAAAEGVITPARLRTALTSSQRGRRDYARGRGDFSVLSHAGNLLMTPLPNSGTAQREMARAFASALGAAGGYLLSGGHGLEGAAAGAAFAPGAMGRGLMSKPAQGYLSGTLPGQKAAASAQQQMPPAANTALRSAVPPAIGEESDEGE
jgi:hypothetical protein